MMRNKSWAILLGAAVILGAAGWWVAASRDSATQADFTPKPLFPGLTAKVNEVASLEIGTAKTLFRIEKAQDGGWVMPNRENYPVRADLVRKNVLGIAGLETVEPRTNKAEHYDLLQVSDPEKYKPADEAAKSDPGPVLVRLVGADMQAMAAVIVGKIRTYPSGGKPGQYHLRKPDEAQAWLAQGNLEVKAEPVEWLVRETVKIDRARVAEATVRHPDGELLRVVRGTKDDGSASLDFVPAGMPKGMKIASQYDVNAVAGAAAWLSFEDVARAETKDFSKPTVAEIVTMDGVKAVIRSIPAEAGSEKKAWVTIDVAYDAALAKPDPANSDLLPAEEAEKQVREAAARVSGWAYLVPEAAARDLSRRMKDLIEPEKTEDKKEG